MALWIFCKSKRKLARNSRNNNSTKNENNLVLDQLVMIYGGDITMQPNSRTICRRLPVAALLLLVVSHPLLLLHLCPLSLVQQIS